MYVELVLFRLCATCPSANHQTTIKTKTSENVLTQLYQHLKMSTRSICVTYLILNDKIFDYGCKFYQHRAEENVRCYKTFYCKILIAPK